MIITYLTPITFAKMIINERMPLDTPLCFWLVFFLSSCLAPPATTILEKNIAVAMCVPRQTILQPKLRTPEEAAFPNSRIEEIDGLQVRLYGTASASQAKHVLDRFPSSLYFDLLLPAFDSCPQNLIVTTLSTGTCSR